MRDRRRNLAHLQVQDLSSVKLVFLPPNATSVFQPQTEAQLEASMGHLR
jgi:hypothetical protein